MIYRLPELSDKEILTEDTYVSWKYDRGCLFCLSALGNLQTIDYGGNT